MTVDVRTGVSVVPRGGLRRQRTEVLVSSHCGCRITTAHPVSEEFFLEVPYSGPLPPLGVTLPLRWPRRHRRLHHGGGSRRFPRTLGVSGGVTRLLAVSLSVPWRSWQDVVLVLCRYFYSVGRWRIKARSKISGGLSTKCKNFQPPLLCRTGSSVRAHRSPDSRLD